MSRDSGRMNLYNGKSQGRHLTKFSIIFVTILIIITSQKAPAQYLNEGLVQQLIPLAESGDSAAQNTLGTMLYYGYGVVKDCDEALKWLRLAAVDGIPEAQSLIGHLYGKGKGCVAQDYTESTMWHQLAAEQGSVHSQLLLGFAYIKGTGVLQDYVEAAKWIRKAAEQGNDNSQHQFGQMYHDGQGVLQNYIYAHMWFNLASAQGAYGAAEDRDSLAKNMTAEDISKAQALARQCVRNDYKGC
jgi:TPR repeat protein